MSHLLFSFIYYPHMCVYVEVCAGTMHMCGGQRAASLFSHLVGFRDQMHVVRYVSRSVPSSGAASQWLQLIINKIISKVMSKQ